MKELVKKTLYTFGFTVGALLFIWLYAGIFFTLVLLTTFQEIVKK